MIERVEADRGAREAEVAAAQVEVGGGANEVRRADAEAAADKALQFGLLRKHVDIAAGRAAPGLCRGRAFDHLDLFDVEGVAGVAAEVADTVDEDVVARAETAQR
jgi:hypothetical protein